MTCPRCASEVPGNATDCPACGIIIAKWRAPRAETTAEASVTPTRSGATSPPAWTLRTPPPPPPPETLGIPYSGWRAAGIGLVLAAGLTWFPFLKFILSPLITIFHELGHTAVLWLFGYSAIPAFDFANGGGVTMSDLERSSMIVWAWAFGIVTLGWWQRERKGVLVALVALTVLYLYMYNSTRETLAITLGGHAGEVAFGALFLYRGLTGWGCKIEAERPLYAFLGFMSFFAGLHLGFSLMGSNSMEKYWYLQGKGGIDNDLVTGAQILSTKLENVARMLVLCELMAIPATFWAASMRKTIGAVAEAEEEV
ncbi:MAG: M50 family metallopeptidase [Vicinamibacteria bacterium]|nr:M50 family metallopeptidase [Vicinamibacteria bacterium]